MYVLCVNFALVLNFCTISNYKCFVTYDGAKLKKVGGFYMPTWLNFVCLVPYVGGFSIIYVYCTYRSHLPFVTRTNVCMYMSTNITAYVYEVVWSNRLLLYLRMYVHM